MDKQFARILMLSVLLPAGAALGEALQQEHSSLAVAEQGVLSRLEHSMSVVSSRPERVRVMGASLAAHHRDPGAGDAEPLQQESRR